MVGVAVMSVSWYFEPSQPLRIRFKSGLMAIDFNFLSIVQRGHNLGVVSKIKIAEMGVT